MSVLYRINANNVMTIHIVKFHSLFVKITYVNMNALLINNVLELTVDIIVIQKTISVHNA